MRKASDVLLLVGAILTFIGLAGVLISGIVFAVLASPAVTQLIIDGLNDGSIHTTSQGTPEEVAAIVQAAFLAVSIVMFVLLIPMVLAGVFALVARRKQNQTWYVVSLVFGIIFSANIITVIGAILGLVEEQPQGAQQ